jgi:antibiotic biosynthesis monooxygenase (ABM) superfamily enzyme
LGSILFLDGLTHNGLKVNSAMIIYSVTVVIKKEVEESWLEWMKEIHMKDVMKTGYFTDCEMQKQLIPEIAADESTYIINYRTSSLDQYNEYLMKEAPRLQKEHIDKFYGKFKASRAVHQIIPG